MPEKDAAGREAGAPAIDVYKEGDPEAYAANKREEQKITDQTAGTHPQYGIFWKRSPDAGHPDCFCSVCKQPIPEKRTPVLRVWTGGGAEARYHHACIPEALGLRQGFLDAEERAEEEEADFDGY